MNMVNKKGMVFTFGRFQPPHKGHSRLISRVYTKAADEKLPGYVFVSQTSELKSNPLTPEEKLKYLTECFPRVTFVSDPTFKNPFDVFRWASELGLEKVVMVVGEDRYQGFQSVHQYIESGVFKFEFELVSIDRTLESGTTMRFFADQGLRKDFDSMCPYLLSAQSRDELYILLRERGRQRDTGSTGDTTGTGKRKAR